MNQNLIQTLLAPETVTVLAGDPKIGKSAFLTALIYANTFLDETLPEGPAFWFSGEEYPRERRWLTQSIPHERQVIEADGVPNLTPGHLEAFLKVVEYPRIIVIDSLWALACLQPKSMRFPLEESLDLLHQVATKTGAAVIAIHCPAKTGPDHIFERLAVNVCAYHSEYSHFGRFITLTLKRHGRKIADPMLIHSRDLGQYEIRQDIRKRILTALTRGAKSTVELARALNVTTEHLRQPLNRLKADGKVIVVGIDGRHEILTRRDQFALETAIPAPNRLLRAQIPSKIAKNAP